MNPFMQIAVAEASRGVAAGHGGPFGAAVVRGKDVVVRAHNEVVSTPDPTAHAEILALRRAAAALGRFDLSDCEIFSTCEPCPMCLAAIHWARIKRIYYGCTAADAAAIGFDDQAIYAALRGPGGTDLVDSVQIDREECLEPFREWTGKTDRVRY
jgi:guanine deaminase